MNKNNIKSTTQLIELCKQNECLLKHSYKKNENKIQITFGFYYKNIWYYSTKSYKANSNKGLYARYIAHAKRIGCKIAD